MTVIIAVLGALLLCSVVTLLWLWHARRRPLSAVDLRMQAVDKELTTADQTGETDRPIPAVSATAVTIPLQRRTAMAQPAAVGKPGPAA